MIRFPFLFAWLAAMGTVYATVAVAEPQESISSRDNQFYQDKIYPILSAKCFSCHSHREKKSKGGLMLDSIGAVLQGGDDGAVVIPGKPEQSLLMKAVEHAADVPHMPPKGKLTTEQIALLKEWIQRGAPGPAVINAMKVRPAGKITAEDKAYWAFQPVNRPELPVVSDPAWVKNPVDCFVRDRLEKEGLQPAPLAEPHSLIRRLYFDLVGLPPSPDEVAAFVARPTELAYGQIVDRLLASPAYGERWASFWLDLVRYAESDGYKADDYRPLAWRYRDYIISSFNNDKPFNRFVLEQLAGDELAPNDPEALTATGFLSLGVYEYNNRDVRGQWQSMLDELTDVTGDVFLGLGVGCARCHDHKFDPILQKDYYRLQAFYAGWQPREDVPLLNPGQKQNYEQRLQAWLSKTAETRKKLQELEAPVKAKAEQEIVSKFNDDLQGLLKKPSQQRDPLEKQIAALAYRQIEYEFERIDKKFKGEQKEAYLKLMQELAKYDAEKPGLPLAMTASDIGPVAPPLYIPKKQQLGPVAPGFPTALDEKPASILPPAMPGTIGRRLTLARWIADPQNPLTARVIVNRVWQQHFGRGLVAQASDFGTLTGPPSHPELLDYLSSSFIKEGWSLKKLHKLIVTSRTYQQSALHPPSERALKKDPENRLLWRMTTRRLEAEQIRDAMLAAADKLEQRSGGPSVPSSQPRRSIYTRIQRNTRDPLLEVFDVPDGILSSAQRHVTTTPTQALLMMNSPIVLEQAYALASRVERDRPGSPTGQIDLAYQLLYGRSPRGEERQAALSFLESQSKLPIPKKQTEPFATAKMPTRDGFAALLHPQRKSKLMTTDLAPDLGKEFTIEAIILLRSVAEDSAVRVICSCWDGNKEHPGWSLGVTGKKSAHQPNNLVLQLIGKSGSKDVPIKYEAVFSGLRLDLNKPYFVAASVRLDQPAAEGIRFYVKDLANDEEPVQTAELAHKVIDLCDARHHLVVGSFDAQNALCWDGLLDDVRLTAALLKPEQYLLSDATTSARTLGYWKFEPTPGPMLDSSPSARHLQLQAATKQSKDKNADRSLVDLCHVLLNANEFLYSD